MNTDLQLEDQLFNHLQCNVSPESSATWFSDVVRAAANVLACTKRTSFKLLTVKELINNFYHAIQSSLIDQNGCTGKEAGSIPVEPVILLGRLVTDSGSGDHYNGEIFFSDGTGCIVCEVTSGISLDCIGDVVLLTKWNYILSVPVPAEIIPAYQKSIRSDHNQLVYLEISGYQLLSSPATTPCAILDDVCTVQLLEQQVEEHKEQSSVQREFSVCGQLVANSMLYRTTIEDRVFMVQLADHHFSNSCHIVVQDRHLLHTTNLLSIGTTYVFTKLRVKIMTYTKKVANHPQLCDIACASCLQTQMDVKVQRRVLTTSRNSKILEYTAAMTTALPASGDNASRKRSLSSGDEDQSQKKHCPDTDSGVVVESLSQHQQQQPLTGVKSATTSSVQSAVSYTFVCGNCHRKVSDNSAMKEEMLVMVWSTTSGGKHHSWLYFNGSVGTITRCISPEAGIYELDSQVQLFLVHKPCMNLCRGLRVGASICLDNVHPVKIIDKKDENVLAFCCCSRSSVKVASFSPINTPYEPLVVRKSLIAHYGHSLNLKKFHWLYKIHSSLKDKMALVDSHVRNGHIRKVFATLYKYSGLVSDKRDIYEEFLSTPHYCPSATIVEQTPYSGAWRLPNMKELSEELQKMLDNKVVQFRSGGVLPLHREKLRTSQDTLTSWTYGVVDQTQFHTPIILVGLVQGSSTGQLVLKDTSGEVQLVICSSYYDDHCMAERRPSIPQIAKMFGQSVVLKKWFIIIEKTTGTFQCWDRCTIYVLCSEADIFATDVSQMSLLEGSNRKPFFISNLYKQPVMLKCEDTKSVILKYTIECISTGKAKASIPPGNKKYFNLSRRHLCFYPLLHFGCKYQAVGDRDVINNAIFVEGTPDVNGDVLEVTDIVSNYKLTHESESINIKVVNFTGILIKRKFCYKQDFTVPEQYSNLTEIKEGKVVYIRELGCGPVTATHLKSFDINPVYSRVKLVMEVEGRCIPDTILVYYDLTLTPEPAGLIPGAVLLFTHFQITYNYGRLTCSSSALSKVEVLSVDPTKIQNTTSKISGVSKDSSLYIPSDKLPLKVLMMPTSLLGMLSSKLLDGLLTHGCVKLRCVIVTILWMRIQYKCATCDKLIVSEKCAPFCSLQQPKFSAECKLIITDGSAEALLYCYDSLVPIVFGCSLNEWKSLEDKTQQFGELTYQKLKKSAGLLPQPHHGCSSDSEVSASVFLAKLASRQSVSRNITICASPFLTNAEAFTPGSKMRQIYINKVCHDTFVLPRIQLRAMIMGPVDCLMECSRLFQQLEQESA